MEFLRFRCRLHPLARVVPKDCQVDYPSQNKIFVLVLSEEKWILEQIRQSRLSENWEGWENTRHQENLLGRGRKADGSRPCRKWRPRSEGKESNRSMNSEFRLGMSFNSGMPLKMFEPSGVAVAKMKFVKKKGQNHNEKFLWMTKTYRYSERTFNLDLYLHLCIGSIWKWNISKTAHNLLKPKVACSNTRVNGRTVNPKHGKEFRNVLWFVAIHNSFRILYVGYTYEICWNHS